MITQSTKKELIKAAKDALKNEYAVSNKENYSAAVLTTKGNIYSAVSYYSDTYSLTLHGEQAALAHAAAHGEWEIEAISIASNEDKNKGEFTNPCHMCKQLLYESSRRSKREMVIILSNNHEEVKEVQLSEMISYPWPVK
jgi:cytidine deaminase